MTALNATAKAAIKDAGFTLAEWARMHSSPDGKWYGDQCGCPDNRCANGFHHVGTDDCGCLPVLLDQAVTWRQAVRDPNTVWLSAPYGLYNWVTVSADAALVTVSATAGGPDAENAVVRIEPREGWSAEIAERDGQIEIRFAREAVETAPAAPGEKE